ncbi:TetR/AcrR family transcriptional regulator [Paenibacillus rigui]|uniref:TetR family transcriptional regulator n=1 Tax=Paenibacillus rigui TaxID=554312 RepID=A0A229UQ36_9BACL|nr:TetR/AcrR family transcriptional regulator [Paenibacillus rigui]OXM85474.1 TetR family transcriptional regulator [Paenibacillus rigui]
MNNEASTDLRIQRTLRAIDDAFISLMGEKGFDKMTVRDITARAVINRATFYLHYKDKYDLLEKLTDHMLDQLQKAMQLPPDFSAEQLNMNTDEPPVSFIRQFEHISTNATFYKVMLSHNGIPGFAERMEGVIRLALFERQTLAQPDEQHLLLPREFIIRYATAAHIGIMKHWLDHNMPYSPTYMALQLKRLHLLGPTHLSLQPDLGPPRP